jgi:hypothetical protein
MHDKKFIYYEQIRNKYLQDLLRFPGKLSRVFRLEECLCNVYVQEFGLRPP